MNVKQTPYIVLASQRTGSTYLTQLLNSHPNIISYSELFHEFHIFWGIGGKRMREAGWRLLLRNLFPVTFLRMVLRGNPRKVPSCIGFKLTYDQAERLPQIVDYITSHRFKIIHLKRKNLLHTFVSMKLAQRTGLWHKYRKRSWRRVPKTILWASPRECWESFISIRMMEHRSDRMFASLPVLEVYYEDLIQNKGAELGKIFRFLKVPKRKTWAIMTKINTRPIADVLINYSELKRYFSHSKWSSFFLKKS